MLRNGAKRILERALCLAMGRAGAMGGHAVILAYHNVIPDDAPLTGEQALHLRLGAFRRQLDLLTASTRVVPLQQLLAGDRWLAGPVVAITFDDAYRGAVEVALPELARRGLPSTMFVAPGLLGEPSFWWDELAASPAQLGPKLRESLLQAQAGQAQAIRQLYGPATPLPQWYGGATAAALLAAVRNGPVTLGAHSWSHPNLARLDSTELAAELERPLAWLREQDPTALPLLAYPYGLTSPAVGSALRAAGYAGGLLVDGGWVNQAGAEWQIPRFNVPSGLSADGLYLRLTGVLGLT